MPEPVDHLEAAAELLARVQSLDLAQAHALTDMANSLRTIAAELFTLRAGRSDAGAVMAQADDALLQHLTKALNTEKGLAEIVGSPDDAPPLEFTTWPQYGRHAEHTIRRAVKVLEDSRWGAVNAREMALSILQGMES